MDLDMSSETACTHRDSSRMCKVEGCCFDLEAAGRYCWKRRICPTHMRADEVKCRDAGDSLWRFCHQCGKLEPLERFEGAKRSCTASLLKRRSYDAGDRTASRTRRRGSNSKRASATISEGSMMPLPEEALLSRHDMCFAESIAATLVEAMWEAAAAPEGMRQQQQQQGDELDFMHEEQFSQPLQTVHAVRDPQYNGGGSSSRSYMSEPLPQLLAPHYSNSFNTAQLLHYHSGTDSAVHAVQPALQQAVLEVQPMQFGVQYNASNNRRNSMSAVYEQQGISKLCNLLTNELQTTVGELGGLLHSQRYSLDCSTTNENRDESTTPCADSCGLSFNQPNNSFHANNGNGVHGGGSTMDSSNSSLMALLEQELRTAAAAVSQPLGSVSASVTYPPAAAAAMMPAACGSAPLPNLQQLQPPACNAWPAGMTAMEASFNQHTAQLLGSGSCKHPASAAGAAAVASVTNSYRATAPSFGVNLPTAAPVAAGVASHPGGGVSAAALSSMGVPMVAGAPAASPAAVAAAAVMPGVGANCTSQLPLQACIAKLTLLTKLQQAQEVLNEIQQLRQQAQQLEHVLFLQ